MSLVWHIMRKDLRRMAGPAALWLFLVVATSGWFAISAGTNLALTAADAYAWMPTLQVIAGLVQVLRWVFLYLLVGALALEDPVAEASAFWATRPIAAGRLALAKLCAILVLFLALPELALLPVWLARGFSSLELVIAAVDFATAQLTAILVSFMVALLTRNLTQFVFGSVALLLAGIACAALPSLSRAVHTDPTTMLSLLWSLSLPATILVGLHQVFSRRTRRSWGLVAGVFLVALFLPGIVLALNPPRPRTHLGRTLDRQDTLAGVTGSFSPGQMWPVSVEVTTASRASHLEMPMGGRGTVWGDHDEASDVDFKTTALADRDLAQLAIAQGITAAHWTLIGRFATEANRPAQISAETLSAELNMGLVRPLRHSLDLVTGTRVDDGAASLRMVALEPEHDGGTSVLIAARDAAYASWFTHRQIPGRMTAGPWRDHDRFLLVSAGNDVMSLRADRVGAVTLDSMVIGYWRIHLPATAGSAPWRNAHLLRLRFETTGETTARIVVPLTRKENPAS